MKLRQVFGRKDVDQLIAHAKQFADLNTIQVYTYPTPSDDDHEFERDLAHFRQLLADREGELAGTDRVIEDWPDGYQLNVALAWVRNDKAWRIEVDCAA